MTTFYHVVFDIVLIASSFAPLYGWHCQGDSRVLEFSGFYHGKESAEGVAHGA
jgi:hypothetical protein